MWEILLGFLIYLIGIFLFPLWSTSGQLGLRFFSYGIGLCWRVLSGLFSTALGLLAGRASGYNSAHRVKEVTGVNLGVASYTNEKGICPDYTH